MDASLFAIDPPSARRLTEGVGTLGVPLKVRRACGASNTGLCGKKDNRSPSAHAIGPSQL
jgi:hypothetical protein